MMLLYFTFLNLLFYHGRFLPEADVQLLHIISRIVFSQDVFVVVSIRGYDCLGNG